ncbi:hypothetical protein CSUI_002186 [Cystoisospora suis]|uniref:Uncharacterized protein n=1 Tax=Cystoisospora suis TaxID=483139 RepID=A0A2C6L5Q2_9APIC|nr:hypothetical protein CSUI_002186 [Cystoisospora suis]
MSYAFPPSSDGVGSLLERRLSRFCSSVTMNLFLVGDYAEIFALRNRFSGHVCFPRKSPYWDENFFPMLDLTSLDLTFRGGLLGIEVSQSILFFQPCLCGEKTLQSEGKEKEARNSMER